VLSEEEYPALSFKVQEPKLLSKSVVFRFLHAKLLFDFGQDLLLELQILDMFVAFEVEPFIFRV